MLAAIAPYTEQGIEIRDARELRVKESDRIAAVATNLRAMGAASGRAGGWTEDSRRADTARSRDLTPSAIIASPWRSRWPGCARRGRREFQRADAAVISYPAFFETLESLLER